MKVVDSSIETKTGHYSGMKIFSKSKTGHYSGTKIFEHIQQKYFRKNWTLFRQNYSAFAFDLQEMFYLLLSSRDILQHED